MGVTKIELPFQEVIISDDNKKGIVPYHPTHSQQPKNMLK
jgi:hypothetical protein